MSVVDPAHADEPTTKPNIIFILSDDLGFGDYGVFFQNLRRANADRAKPWHLTPNLDAMADQGIQLRQHYCPASVCAPSRASLLLGVHQGHSNVRDKQFDKALEDNHTLGTVMRGAGYATAAIGKWGLQGGSALKTKEVQAEGNPGVWPAYPTKRGFDDYFGYVRHMDGHAHYPKEDGKQVWDNDHEVSRDLDKCYTADLFTARAKKWIVDQQASNPQKPFFLYLAYDTPHAKLQLPATPYPAEGVQWTGRAGHMINTAAGEPDTYMHPDYAEQTWDNDRDPATPEIAWPDVYKRYAADVRRIDDAVGDLLKLLHDLKIDDQTLVVFTTDNGPSRESYLPEDYEPTFFDSYGPFDGIKRDLWEGGIRVGAIVRWPGGVKRNQISENPSQFHDWMPTFAELADVAPPARCDGVSLIPTLTGNGEQKPSRVYVEYANNQKTPDYSEFETAKRGRVRQQMQAIREGDLIGVRYDIHAHSDPFEIYDVTSDPKQTKNLAVEFPQLDQQMHDSVLRLRRPNQTAPRPYDDVPIPSVELRKLSSGVQWATFEMLTPWLPRMDEMISERMNQASTIEACKPLDAKHCVFINGLIDVPVDGKYTFTFPANVTALLRIHDATLIDLGFAPIPQESSASIMLAAGRHPFRLYWQNADLPPTLEISGSLIDRQSIPASMLYSP